MKFYNKQITSLKPNEIFVFGSNLKGIHGAGAAKLARDKFGASIGIGFGFRGQSYAIPTKSDPYSTLSLTANQSYVDLFGIDVDIGYRYNFYVTQIGCGLAGYTPAQIAPMFRCIKTDNVYYHEDWRPYLE